MLDPSLSALIWWIIGYPFAYGTTGNNGFIGAGQFFLASYEDCTSRMCTYSRTPEATSHSFWFFNVRT